MKEEREKALTELRIQRERARVAGSKRDDALLAWQDSQNRV